MNWFLDPTLSLTTLQAKERPSDGESAIELILTI